MYGAYPGNSYDANNDSLFGGFDIDGNESPGNRYNIDGELESCDPGRYEYEDVENTGELHPCNGTWHSDENNIYLKNIRPELSRMFR